MNWVTREYICDVCNTQHKIQLPEDLASKHTLYPFSYFHLHGETKDILSTLYIDAELRIRGAETQKLNTGLDDIFSKGQAFSIIQNLMNELNKWQTDYHELKKKYDELKGD